MVPCPAVENVDDAMSCKKACDRHVSTSQGFPDDLDVRYYSFLLPGMKCSRAAHATHDFVEYDQRAVLVANGFHGLEISGDGWYASERLAMPHHGKVFN